MRQAFETTAEQHNVARRALKLFVLIFMLCALLITVFKRTDLFPWIGDCHPSSSNDQFLAYCHSIRFGDYEHFAYYHQSEPEAVRYLKKAEVLFLGNSNTQFAFSTSAITRYFESAKVQHYVFGFGHGAQSGVAKSVWEKLDLSPKLIVINADPFFTGEVNATFARLLEAGAAPHPVWENLPMWLRPTVFGEHARKRWLQQQQRARCDGSVGKSHWCNGTADTLYRRVTDGHWNVANYRENLQIPVSNDDALHIDHLANYADVAEEFIQVVGLPKQCVVLTVTPRSSTPGRYVQQLARLLNTPLIVPNVENLLTIDGSHLQADSAERWSAAWVKMLTPVLNNCLQDANRGDVR